MPEETKLGEPWHCSACCQLMYNRCFIDGDFYPVEGAPVSKFLSTQYPRVCTLCFELHVILDTSAYWIKLDNEKKEKYNNIKKLRPGEDYFTR